jgi:hypothetical protein
MLDPTTEHRGRQGDDLRLYRQARSPQSRMATGWRSATG